ncbi:MAG: hypothetical protein KUG75_12665 [Pseudomonadales bacterium]|nr:hypothetical protein [Pseudomonadales bacterium]
MQGKAAVVGIGETTYYKRGESPKTEFQLASEAIGKAVEDAGLELKDIDGVTSYMESRNDPGRLSAALGMKNVAFAAQPWGGGGNGVAASVALADAAISAGYAKNVVVFRALAQGQFGRFGQSKPRTHAYGNSAYSAVYGFLSPAHVCAMQTTRFMHEYGVTQDSLAEIALAASAHAQLNPRALRYGKPLSRQQYHDSRWIAKPFHLYDCCPENDGATAIVVTTRERARDLKQKPVPILAAAQGLGKRDGALIFNEPAFPTSFNREVGQQIWERAGIQPKDVQVAQFYENFTGPVLMAITEMGFCKPEEINEFVANGNIQGPGGKLPINTSGGNLAECYIHGFELINEAVRQVRGQSTCQVPDVEHSLVVSGPGFSPGSAVLFSSD